MWRISSSKCFIWSYFLLTSATLVLLSIPLVSSSIVKSLPGFSGSLPFKLQTGYIGVDDYEDIKLFYYFIESERNPKEDPLVLWFAGGPGCSSFCPLILENGPLMFNKVEYNGSLPTFSLNPYSWTKVASMIYVDAPVGTGFSYSRTLQGSKIGDTVHAHHTYSFIRKWILGHSDFISNPLYIGGDSYSGLIVPIVVKHLVDENEVGKAPQINIKGYLLGNPVTNLKNDYNARIEYAYRMALISDEIYQSVKKTCKEDYTAEEPETQCVRDLQKIIECTGKINIEHILELNCPSDLPTPHMKGAEDLQVNSLESSTLAFQGYQEQFICRNYLNLLIRVWANDFDVQTALGIHQGSFEEWKRCHNNLPYTNDVQNVISYHQYLKTKGLRVLIYSGDHDMAVPYIGTRRWIKGDLNMTLIEQWRPWLVDGQIAGYVEGYSNNFTFATVKGGGHTTPEYKPKECFAMVEKWFSERPL